MTITKAADSIVIVNTKSAANVHIKLGEQEWDRNVDDLCHATIQIDPPQAENVVAQRSGAAEFLSNFDCD